MNIKDIKKGIEKTKSTLYGYKSKIFYSKEEASEEDLIEVVNYFKSKDLTICIIDKENRDLVIDNVIFAESTFMEKLYYYSNKEKISENANPLRTKPDVIIFRNLLSEDNSKEFVCSHMSGYTIYAFTNLKKEELLKTSNGNTNPFMLEGKDFIDTIYRD